MSGKKRVMPVSRFGHGRSNDLAGHGHHNAAALEMGKSPWIKPIYEVDPNSDEMLWEPWTRALRLRPEAWQAVLQQADEDIRLSLIFLMALQNINEGASKFREDEIDAIDLQAPDLISNCIAAVLPVGARSL